MTTAVTTVLASCHRLLLGRPSFAQANQSAKAGSPYSGFDPDGDGVGLAAAALAVSHYTQRMSGASGHAPKWG